MTNLDSILKSRQITLSQRSIWSRLWFFQWSCMDVRFGLRGQEEKGTTEDEMVGWHHRLNGQGLTRLWELVMDREAWGAVILGVAKSRT